MVADFYFGRKPKPKDLILVGVKFKNKIDITENFLTKYIKTGKTLIDEGFVHVSGGSPITNTENLAKLR